MTRRRRRRLEEYEMQLFGFHSRAVYATLRSIVRERIHSKSRKLCETLEKTYRPDAEGLLVLRENERQLVRAYHAGAAPHLKSIKNIVKKYIAVPNNVLAEEDKLQRVQYTEEEYESMKENLESLQQRAKRAVIFNAALKEELQMTEQFTHWKETVDRICSVVENVLSSCSDVNSKMFKLIRSYEELQATLRNETIALRNEPLSEKVKYNTIRGIKRKEINLDSL